MQWIFLKHLLTAYILQTSGNTPHERVILIITNAAPYMVAAFKILNQSILSKSIHVICVVHAIHCVCEVIREENVNINRFVSLMKKVLLISKER